MLKLRMSKASREAGNQSGVIEGNLFSGYSKRKLYCLSETYGELARLYRGIPQADRSCGDRKDMLYRKQLQEAKKVFANHLDEISDAFADVADTVVHVSIPVEHKRKALIQLLKRQGIIVRELVFIEGGAAGGCEFGQGGYRGNRISIEARIAGKHTVSASVLGEFLSAFFGRKLAPSGESALVIDRGYKIFIYEDEPRYTVLSAISRAVREDEKISGDNFSMEEYNQSQMVVMLADGMGSGEQACKDSQAVIEFMERFLEAGFQKERAFSMVNGAIAAQNGCCNLTTLDICAIDLLTGEAEFVKAGAAASYIKHGNWVDEVAADTLPLGSLDELCPIIQNVKLEDTDMLIMLSDGISDAIENEAAGRLREIISRSRIENPKEMADYLLRYAISSQGGHIRDDMTVLTCCIKRRIGV
ncbi:MAG: SpoIIE family protein phosphatase [Lachnospiraceae bacterium]|nr:SpoIIE family protein phosphatase [Lachnospiraceae bacterium]